MNIFRRAYNWFDELMERSINKLFKKYQFWTLIVNFLIFVGFCLLELFFDILPPLIIHVAIIIIYKVYQTIKARQPLTLEDLEELTKDD
jgi:hypothetical protein